MQYQLESCSLSEIRSDVVVLCVFLDEDVADLLKKLRSTESASTNAKTEASQSGPTEESKLETSSQSFIDKIAGCLKDEGFSGKSGQSFNLPTLGALPFKNLLVVGLGKRASLEASSYRKLAANMARRLLAKEMTASVCFVHRGTIDQSSELRAIVEGWVLGSYTFQKYKSAAKQDKRAKLERLSLLGFAGSAEEFKRICESAEIIASSTNMARALIAEPPSFMTPTRLSQEAQRIATEHGLRCEIIDAEKAKEMGMGSFLGVARGANEPAKFIVLRYESVGAKHTIGLIGKGITFDSGGLSLKPAVSMEHMKYDMSGAAVVLGAMQVVGSLKPKVSVLGVIAATENMPGPDALHPGDVLTAMNGKTIEVNNTDAEGRLVLADALTYACRNGADEMVDVATLTGAIVTALGRAAAGIMGNNQGLIDKVIKCGADAGEKLWQLPMFDEYKESLKSDVADLKNAGSRGEAGSICAGMFLAEFAENKPWAHLDICGPGWLDKDRDECNKGGTAFGVRTLSYYVLRSADKAAAK